MTPNRIISLTLGKLAEQRQSTAQKISSHTTARMKITADSSLLLRTLGISIPEAAEIVRKGAVATGEPAVGVTQIDSNEH